MPLSYEALLRVALTDPDAERELSQTYLRSAAILVIGFTGSRRRIHAYGPVYAAALGLAVETALRSAFAHQPPALAIRRLRDGLLLAFAEPEAALHAAMNGQISLATLNADRREGARRDPIGAGMGLGFGEVLISPEPDVLGAEADAAFHLAGGAASGEILASDAYVAALGAPPPGVGAHRGRADRIHAIGMAFTALLDYRS